MAKDNQKGSQVSSINSSTNSVKQSQVKLPSKNASEGAIKTMEAFLNKSARLDPEDLFESILAKPASTPVGPYPNAMPNDADYIAGKAPVALPDWPLSPINRSNSGPLNRNEVWHSTPKTGAYQDASQSHYIAGQDPLDGSFHPNLPQYHGTSPNSGEILQGSHPLEIVRQAKNDSNSNNLEITNAAADAPALGQIKKSPSMGDSDFMYDMSGVLRYFRITADIPNFRHNPPPMTNKSSPAKASDESDFLPKVSVYTNEILKAFQESMISDLPGLLQTHVEQLVDEMTKPEMLQAVLNIIIPDTFSKALEEMTENTVNLVIQSALGQNTLEQVLPMMDKGQVACSKPCNCPGNPDSPGMAAGNVSGNRSKSPLTPKGSNVSKDRKKDFDYPGQKDQKNVEQDAGKRPLTSKGRNFPGQKSQENIEHGQDTGSRPNSRGKRPSRNLPDDFDNRGKKDQINKGQDDDFDFGDDPCSQFGFPSKKSSFRGNDSKSLRDSRSRRLRSRPLSKQKIYLDDFDNNDDEQGGCPCMKKGHRTK